MLEAPAGVPDVVCDVGEAGPLPPELQLTSPVAMMATITNMNNAGNLRA
jgi:hypothetical protein